MRWGRLLCGLLLAACGAAPPAALPRLVLPPETVLYGGAPTLGATLARGTDFLRRFVPVPDPRKWLEETLKGVEPAARLDGPWHFIVLQLPADRVGIAVLLPRAPAAPGTDESAARWRPATFADRPVAAGNLRADTAIITDVPEWADTHRELLEALRALEPGADLVIRVAVDRFYDRARWSAALDTGSEWEREPTLDFMAQVAETELGLSLTADGLVADLRLRPRPRTAFARWATAARPIGETTWARVPAKAPFVMAADFGGPAWKPALDALARVEAARIAAEGATPWDHQRQRLADALAGDFVMGLIPGAERQLPSILARFGTHSDAAVQAVLDAPPAAPVLYQVGGVPIRALAVGQGATEAQLLVHGGELVIAGGDAVRPVLEAVLGGTLEHGLAAHAALSAAHVRAGPAFFIASCNVLDVLRMTHDPDTEAVLGDLHSETALTLSAAATDGALRLRLDLPLEHLQAIWTLVMRMESSGGALPRRFGLPDWI